MTNTAEKEVYNLSLPHIGHSKKRVKKGWEIMKDIYLKGAAEEAIYLLDYEKKRIETCARTLEELAKVFVYPYTTEQGKELITENVKDRQNVLWKTQLMENRELFADNMKEMATIMGQVAKKKVQVLWFSERRKKQVIHILEEEGLKVLDIYRLENEKENRIYAIRLKCKKNVQCTSEELAGYLSVLFNVHLQAVPGTAFFIPQEYTTVYFEEEPRMVVMGGYAKAVKESEKISGDNYSFFETGNGYYLAVLSDGMGSGEKACADSAMVVEMAEKLMDVGFSIESTAQTINDALLVGAEHTNMSTLDLCGIDLYEETMAFVKIGSACTYIKNRNSVEKICSVSLPLGVFRKQNIEVVKRKIHDGDYVVMLSDGIIDCITRESEEDYLKEFIAELQYERPTEIANCIMKYVLNLSKGRIRDDMTVLVMGIWENKYE